MQNGTYRGTVIAMHSYNKTFNNNISKNIVYENQDRPERDKYVRWVSVSEKDGLFDYDEAAKLVIWAIGKEKLTKLLKKIDTSLKSTNKASLTDKTWSTSLTSERATWANGRVITGFRVVDGFQCRDGRATFNFDGREVDIIGNEVIENLYFYLLTSDLNAFDTSEVESLLNPTLEQEEIRWLVDSQAYWVKRRGANVEQFAADVETAKAAIADLTADLKVVGTVTGKLLIETALVEAKAELENREQTLKTEALSLKMHTTRLKSSYEQAALIDKDYAIEHLHKKEVPEEIICEITGEETAETDAKIIELKTEGKKAADSEQVENFSMFDSAVDLLEGAPVAA